MAAQCTPLDVACNVREAVKIVIESWAKGVANFGKDVLIAAFGGDGGGIAGEEWAVATTMTSKWSLILLVVVIGITAVQICMSMLQGNLRMTVSAVIWGVLAWPATLVSVFLAIQVTRSTDQLAVGILNEDSEDTVNTVVSKMFETVNGQNLLNGGSLASVAGADDSAAQLAVISVILALGMTLSAIFLSLMLAFRNFALLVLIGFAPLAFMAMPAPSLRGWALRWAQAVIALIVAKPLAAGMLVMAGELLGASDQIFSWVVGIVAMLMAGFAPMITMRMFSFIGGETAAAYGSHGSAVLNNTAQGATRVGSTALGR